EKRPSTIVKGSPDVWRPFNYWRWAIDLTTQLQLIDQIAIFVAIDRSQIIQKPPAGADQFEQTLARTIIFSVRLEVGRELVDSFRHERNLNSRTACVGGVLFKALNGGFFNFLS